MADEEEVQKLEEKIRQLEMELEMKREDETNFLSTRLVKKVFERALVRLTPTSILRPVRTIRLIFADAILLTEDEENRQRSLRNMQVGTRVLIDDTRDIDRRVAELISSDVPRLKALDEDE